jgi:hypothetical protein
MNKEEMKKAYDKYRAKSREELLMQHKLLDELNRELLFNIKANTKKLKKLLKEVNFESEDLIYRFYHHSFKVYWIQSLTVKMVDALKSLAPKGWQDFNYTFDVILKEGSDIKWESKHNLKWEQPRKILEAFFHARYFLEMAIKSGKEMDDLQDYLPSYWAGLLYFYNLR